MMLQVDFWQFLGAMAGLLAAFGGLLLGIGKSLLGAFVTRFERQLDQRFAAQAEKAREVSLRWDARAVEIEAQLRALERGQAGLKEEMLREYVRREDAIRDQTVTQAKLDALAAKIELLWQSFAAARRGGTES